MIRFLFYLLFTLILLVSCKSGGEKTAPAPAVLTDSADVADIREVLGIAIIEPAGRIVALAAERGGVVREIRAEIGRPVQAGQPLLLLDARVENAQLRQAQSKIAAQQEAVQVAAENLKLLETQIKKAEADLARDEALFAGKALTQKELENSRFQVNSLRREAEGRQAAVRQQQARLLELQADIAYYQTLTEEKTIRAPLAGTLLSLDTKQGAFLEPGKPIGDFAPAGPLIALTEIDELFAGKVQAGQKAFIRPQGKKDTLSTGVVVMTSPYLRKKSLFSDQPGDLEDRRVREVRVRLDRPEAVLIGARVECVIVVE
jgi:multidrug resistance efflux pump